MFKIFWGLPALMDVTPVTEACKEQNYNLGDYTWQNINVGLTAMS
jgi:hypothetical protein